MSDTLPAYVEFGGLRFKVELKGDTAGVRRDVDGGYALVIPEATETAERRRVLDELVARLRGEACAA